MDFIVYLSLGGLFALFIVKLCALAINAIYFRVQLEEDYPNERNS